MPMVLLFLPPYISYGMNYYAHSYGIRYSTTRPWKGDDTVFICEISKGNQSMGRNTKSIKFKIERNYLGSKQWL